MQGLNPEDLLLNTEFKEFGNKLKEFESESIEPRATVVPQGMLRSQVIQHIGFIYDIPHKPEFTNKMLTDFFVEKGFHGADV